MRSRRSARRSSSMARRRDPPAERANQSAASPRPPSPPTPRGYAPQSAARNAADKRAAVTDRSHPTNTSATTAASSPDTSAASKRPSTSHSASTAATTSAGPTARAAKTATIHLPQARPDAATPHRRGARVLPDQQRATTHQLPRCDGTIVHEHQFVRQGKNPRNQEFLPVSRPGPRTDDEGSPSRSLRATAARCRATGPTRAVSSRRARRSRQE